MSALRTACRLSLFLAPALACAAEGSVALLRTPEGGLQPQAAIAPDGAVHLLFYRGEAAAGNLYYAMRQPNAERFGPAMRVNRRENSAVAAGTIRGGHLALGRLGRPHVAWMGSAKHASAGSEGRPEAPMFYARLQSDGAAFEPERNLMQWTQGLDGGGSLAADGEGNVYVAWHGSAPGNQLGEAGRAVFVAHSNDDGATFERERQANPSPTGACGCCGMRAMAGRGGQLQLLYRAANARSRDMTLLTSRDRSRTFDMAPVDSWLIQTCPMSSASMAGGVQGLLLGFEGEGRVKVLVFPKEADGAAPVPLRLQDAAGKHPTVAVNARGETLVAWAEGAGWGKGGVLRWQRFDRNGRAVSEPVRGEPIPVWSLPAAVAVGAENFLIIY